MSSFIGSDDKWWYSPLTLVVRALYNATVENGLIHSQKHLSLWLLLKETKANTTEKPITVQAPHGVELTITPGVIDENSEQYYLYGQCVALATTLAKKINGTVRIGYEHDGELIHAWVVKDGRKIDITGVEYADTYEEPT